MSKITSLLPPQTGYFKGYTPGDIDQFLWRFVEQEGSQKAVAEKLGMSAAHFNDLLHKRRGYSKKLLDAIGLAPVEFYILKSEATDTKAGE